MILLEEHVSEVSHDFEPADGRVLELNLGVAPDIASSVGLQFEMSESHVFLSIDSNVVLNVEMVHDLCIDLPLRMDVVDAQFLDFSSLVHCGSHLFQQGGFEQLLKYVVIHT